MPLILRIDYNELLLPDDAPIATLLKCLQRAMRVRDRTYDMLDPRLVVERNAQIEIKTIPAGTRIVAAIDGRDQEVEVASPANHGSRPGTGLVPSRRRRPARPAACPLLEREP